MVRTWIRTLRSVIAHHSAPQRLEPDPRNPSGPAVRWPHSTGRIHDRSRSCAVYVSCRTATFTGRRARLAQAAKNARVAWALLVSGETYRRATPAAA